MSFATNWGVAPGYDDSGFQPHRIADPDFLQWTHSPNTELPISKAEAVPGCV